MLPTVDFFGNAVTRMIIGDNPVNGHSYIHEIISGQEMKDYYTDENVVNMLFAAQNAGFNTILPLACPDIFNVLRKFISLGGHLNIIFQPYPAVPLEKNIDEMLEFKPIGIYHQGTTTDYLLETDQASVLKSNLELIRKTGLPVGLCSHVPETVMRAEEEHWDVDFYLACLYNARRNRRGTQSGYITKADKSGLIFYPEDRFIMFETIRNIRKPVIAYKVLAGGQVFSNKDPKDYRQIAQSYIKEAYDNIKPTDLLCVGVFQRDTDQITQNAETVARILNAGK